MRFPATFTLMACIFAASISYGEEIAFVFEGTVSQNHLEPYGITAAQFSPVTGRFIYDTDVAASHTSEGCECAGYRQQIAGGFWADFDDAHVRADDYVVEVTNNVAQPDGSVFDFVTIQFADNLDPSLALPLSVNGTPQSKGLFVLSFAADQSQFSSVALPNEISLDDFFSDYNFLTDSTDFQATTGSALFTISSLTRSPVVSGDYNFDGTVNGDDLSIWKASFGSTDNLSADGNRDGIVDSADFTVWRDARDTAQIVPEPQTTNGWLVLASVFFEIFRRRQTGRRHGHSQA